MIGVDGLGFNMMMSNVKKAIMMNMRIPTMNAFGH